MGQQRKAEGAASSSGAANISGGASGSCAGPDRPGPGGPVLPDPHGTAYRQQLLDSFLKNKVSAPEAVAWAKGSSGAGARGVSDIGRMKGKGNFHRSIMRKCKKLCKGLPDLYWAKIPVLNRRTNQMEEVWHPFLLPFEWLCAIIKEHTLSRLVPGETSSFRAQVEALAKQLAEDPAKFVALGLHGDGVPLG